MIRSIHPLDVARFTIGRVAAAAGIPLPALATALRRGDLALGGSEEADALNPGTGQHRLFTPRRALHIAVTAALVRCGMTLKAASLAALAFSDHGLNDSEAVATIEGDPLAAPRSPGQLYPDGTVLRILHPFDGAPVVALDRRETVHDPFTLDHHRYLSVAIVDVDAVVGRALEILGLDRDICR